MPAKKRISSREVKRYIEPVFKKYSRLDGGGRMNVKTITYRIGLIRKDEAEARGEDVSGAYYDQYAPSGNTVRSVLQGMIKTGKHVKADHRIRNVKYSYTSTEHLDKIANAKNADAAQELLAKRLTEALGLPFNEGYRDAGHYDSDDGGTVQVSLSDLARMVDMVEHYTNSDEEE